jgi:hypothetical protein
MHGEEERRAEVQTEVEGDFRMIEGVLKSLSQTKIHEERPISPPHDRLHKEKGV